MKIPIEWNDAPEEVMELISEALAEQLPTYSTNEENGYGERGSIEIIISNKTYALSLYEVK